MSVRVVARIRPLLPRELEKDIIVRAGNSEEGQVTNVVKIPSPKNEAEEFSFAFNAVYDQSSTQEELFNAEVAPHIKALFQGLDLTLFAYGVTGTGKTHTMRGGLKLAERGVIPRLLSHVFRRGKKITKDAGGATTVAVALSYYEIYNDKVYDLLEPPEKRTPSGLPLREKDNRTFVVGLSEQACADLRDFERLYIAANQNRVTAATKLNAHSSRSHAILRVKVTQTTHSADGGTVLRVRESTASAIDLAGSEDNRRTDNDRQRLIESAAINKSLFVLSQCVDAISRGEKRIPYRESKMTRILSLGQNNGITVMILNLAPIRSYHLDTLSSLNVSSRAKRIEVREIENEVVFKQQPPRSLSHTSSSSSLGSCAPAARQPLRALTSSAHNIQSGAAAAVKATADKPVKAFAVYTDQPIVKTVSKPTTGTTTPTSRLVPLQPRRSTSSANASISSHTSANRNKRTAEISDQRPSKLARPSTHMRAPAAPKAAVQSAQTMSAEEIENIIERKVAEALAARDKEKKQLAAEAEQTTAAAAAAAPFADSVQKRLDELERRIDDSNSNNERAEGLRFLLLARQHKEANDDSEALHCYEQALPFFPGQTKLLGKIEKLKAKIAMAAGSGEGIVPLFSKSPKRCTGASPRRRRHIVMQQVTESTSPAQSKINECSECCLEEMVDADADVDEDDVLSGRSATRRNGGKGKSTKSANAVARSGSAAGLCSRRKTKDTVVTTAVQGDDADDEAPLTPRKQHLLDIINSRDIARIRSLAGVGAKKARDLVNYLDAGIDDESKERGCDSDTSLDGVNPTTAGRRQIGSVAQLRSVPGMGGRTVERAYTGLVV